MPKSALALIGTFAVGVALVALVALTSETPRGFTLGVTSGAIAAELRPGQQACQAPILIPDEHADFSVVRMLVGTYKRPGPPLEVTVSRVSDRALIASGRLAGGYPDLDAKQTQAVPVGRVRDRGPLRVCVRDLGPGRAAIMGNGGLASRTSSATVAGTPIALDLTLSFERAEPRSLAATVPAMFERAALFRAEWVGAWAYVLAMVIVLVALPWLLVRALAAAASE